MKDGVRTHACSVCRHLRESLSICGGRASLEKQGTQQIGMCVVSNHLPELDLSGTTEKRMPYLPGIEASTTGPKARPTSEE